MKALTIKQPWASLIVNEYKTYEFRSWKINYRGKILIHAGMSTENKELDRFKEYNLEYINGAIIGEAYIDDCVLVDEKLYNDLKKINSIVYSNDYRGIYGWHLTKIKMYDKPIYIKGKLGLWNYK